MFTFFFPKDRWKWDPKDGVPNKKVLKLQRQVLNSDKSDEKKRLLEHIVYLVDNGPEFQGAFCDAKVTADVCKCFLIDTPAVQEAAAQALTAVAHNHPGNVAAILSARYKTASQKNQVIPHAIKDIKMFEKNVSLAVEACRLLEQLGSSDPNAVAQPLLHGSPEELCTIMRNCSSLSRASGTSAAKAGQMLLLLEELLQMLQTVAAASGPTVSRELGRAWGVRLLLELSSDHRGREASPEHAAGHGTHEAVVRAALSLLQLVVVQVPAQGLPLLESDAVRRLLAALRDLTLPWSVRLHAVGVLRAVSISPTIAAEVVKAKGLDIVFAFVDEFVNGRAAVGRYTGAALMTPPRGVAAAPASPGAPPFSPADSMWGSPTKSLSGPHVGVDSEVVEPRGVIVVEHLLGLVDAVASSKEEAAAVIEGNRGVQLMGALYCGMNNFQAGGYRMAEACAQVLFRVAGHFSQALPAALCGSNVTGPLTGLLDRGQQSCADARQAQVVHGAWCAAGLLCQVMSAELRRGRRVEVVSGDALKGAVQLLNCTAPALLAAMGVGPSQALSTTGLAFLAKDRVVADLRSSCRGLLNLLVALAEDVVNRPAIRQLGVVAAAKMMLAWTEAQWLVKRLLHLMGELEAEYKPLITYGCGPLLSKLLVSQGIDPAPFLARNIDARILLELQEDYLRGTLGLDDVPVMKIAHIRDAFALFSAIDTVDGRVNGCVSASDVEDYLVGEAGLLPQTAAAMREQLFSDLQVLPGEPICFMQFINCYSWLNLELKANSRNTGKHGRPGDAATAAAGDGYPVRASKRLRTGEFGGGAGAAQGQAGTSRSVIIELE